MAITAGHQAEVRFLEESVPGTPETNPDFLLFSLETQNVKLGLDKNQQESLDIGELDVHEYFSVKDTFSLSVDFHLYDVDRIFDNFVDRNADQSPKSFTIEFIPDVDAATNHYYLCTGWKPSSIEFSTDEDAPWMATITFEGGTIAAPVTTDAAYIGTGSRETKAGYLGAATDPTLKTFVSAPITLDAAPWAVLLGSFSVSIEQNVTAQYNLGSADPVESATVFGGRKITGSGDISLDAGASEQWAKVAAYSAHEIIIPFGTTTGDQELVLENVRFPSIEIDISADTDLIRGGQDFTAQTLSRDTVA